MNVCIQANERALMVEIRRARNRTWRKCAVIATRDACVLSVTDDTHIRIRKWRPSGRRNNNETKGSTCQS